MGIENTCEYAMSREVQEMCTVTKGPKHGPAPIPEEGKWVQAKQITDISAYTHGVGWCAPQQGACKLSLNGIAKWFGLYNKGFDSNRKIPQQFCILQ